jgi:hypothetical protein
MATADTAFLEILGFFSPKPIVMDKFTAIPFSPEFVTRIKRELIAIADAISRLRDPSEYPAGQIELTLRGRKSEVWEGNGGEYGCFTTNSLSRGPKALEALVHCIF